MDRKFTPLEKKSRQQFNPEDWTRCGICSGSGFVPKVFATSDEAACIECNGIGWIPPDGEKLSECEAIVFLRVALNRKDRGLRFAHYELRNLRPESEPQHPLVEFYRQPGYKGD